MYDFYTKMAVIINSGQTKSVHLGGNIYDLYWNGSNYVPLINFILDKTAPWKQRIKLVFKFNEPLSIGDPKDREVLKIAWAKWRLSMSGFTLETMVQQIKNGAPSLDDYMRQFDSYWLDVIGHPEKGLEFLRQMCIASREQLPDRDLLIIMNNADALFPNGGNVSEEQMQRILKLQEWILDPNFNSGRDVVILIVETKSQMHDKVARLPQLMSVEIPSPDAASRRHAIDDFISKNPKWPDGKFEPWKEDSDLSVMTAAFSIYALQQLLTASLYSGKSLTKQDVLDKVEEHIKSQLGDVVSFKRPMQKISDIIGNSFLKKFMMAELKPLVDKKKINAIIVTGPIGSGKTFQFEALMGELGMPILTLGNIRDQWYGQTDVKFSRLKRMAYALERVGIDVDECDTQLGSVDKEDHSTEKRLVGQIQDMMSDPGLKEKVFWILMTARIHRVSADIKRPGRGGNLIIPVLDAEGEDRLEFIRWALKSVLKGKTPEEALDIVQLVNIEIEKEYSAAAFALLKDHISFHARDGMTAQEITALIKEILPPYIGKERQVQKLHALLNCTRLSLLPPSNEMIQVRRAAWEKELNQYE